MAAQPTDQRAAMLAMLQKTKERLQAGRPNASTPSSSSAAAPEGSAKENTGGNSDENAVTTQTGGPAPPAPDFLSMAQPATLADARRLQPRNVPDSVAQRAHFIDTWAQKIESFVYDNSRTIFELPVELSAFDRKTLHQLANKYNLNHNSQRSGDGAPSAASGGRRLILRKDHLFYAATAKKPQSAALEAMKQQPLSRQMRQMQRHAEKLPEKEQFADRDAYKAFRKLQKATNRYANAVETAATEEDVFAMEQAAMAAAGGEFSSLVANESPSATDGWAMALAAASANNAASDDAEFGAISAAQASGELFEVCTTCGTKSTVDYDPRQWECSGPCETCGTVTLFELQTKAGAELVHRAANARQQARTAAAAEDEDEPATTSGALAGVKRPRETELTKADAAPMLTAAELVDLAEMNELPAADVKWVEAFAKSREKQGATCDHVLFCAEWEDFPKYVPAVSDSNHTLVFCTVPQDPASSEHSGPVTRKINKLLIAIEKNASVVGEAGNETSATRDVFVGFPGTIEEPVTAVVAVALHRSKADEATVKLAARSVPGAAITCSEVAKEVLPA